MGLKEDSKFLIDYAQKKSETLEHNHILFNIFEGNLLPYVLADLQKQLSIKAYAQIKHRVSPINILRRLIQKLSKIYAIPPTRIIGENETDRELLSEYENEFDANTTMSLGNEFFNLFKNTLIEPYLNFEGYPRLRTVPSDRFVVYSNDKVNPMRMTHLLKYMGKNKDKKIYYAYTDQEFLILDEFGNIEVDMMNSVGNDGTNIYGKIPAVYINRSKHELIPQIDTDTLAMSKLIPVLLSDLNYAVFYQSFSVIYAIDANVENLVMAPNALWDIKSDPTSDKTPQIGSLKPTVDIDQVIKFIKDQISLWLTSRNVKAGAIGALTAENAASGIAKAIDEIDTSEDRQMQVSYFKNAEENQLWPLIINHMHPVWLKDANFKLAKGFSPGAKVNVQFSDQAPMQDTSKLIDDMIKLKNAGLITNKVALKNIYPDLDDEQVAEMLGETEDQNTVEVPIGEQEIRSNLDNAT